MKSFLVFCFLPGQTHSQQLPHHWMIRVGNRQLGLLPTSSSLTSFICDTQRFSGPRKGIWSLLKGFCNFYISCWHPTFFRFVAPDEKPCSSFEKSGGRQPSYSFLLSMCIVDSPWQDQSLPFTGKGNDSDADRLKNLPRVTALISGRIWSEPSCS